MGARSQVWGLSRVPLLGTIPDFRVRGYLRAQLVETVTWGCLEEGGARGMCHGGALAGVSVLGLGSAEVCFVMGAAVTEAGAGKGKERGWGG